MPKGTKPEPSRKTEPRSRRQCGICYLWRDGSIAYCPHCGDPQFSLVELFPELTHTHDPERRTANER